MNQDLDENLKRVTEKLHEALTKTGKNLNEVKLLGVSKYQPTTKIKYLAQKGLTHFGESYVQEALPKMQELELLNLHWHFIGRLQTKKINKVLGQFELIESIDSKKLFEEMDKRARDQQVTQKVLIQINVGDEASKAGVDLGEANEICEWIQGAQALKVCGLMCLPPLTEDEHKKRADFQKMHELFNRIQSELVSSEQRADFKELSMGTSHDFHLAIEEGASIVRVGTSLFGQRPEKSE